MNEKLEKEILRLINEIEYHERQIRKHIIWEDQDKIDQHKESIERKLRLLEILKK